MGAGAEELGVLVLQSPGSTYIRGARVGASVVIVGGGEGVVVWLLASDPVTTGG